MARSKASTSAASVEVETAGRILDAATGDLAWLNAERENTAKIRRCARNWLDMAGILSLSSVNPDGPRSPALLLFRDDPILDLGVGGLRNDLARNQLRLIGV